MIVAVVAISASAATFPSDDRVIVHVLSRVGYGPRPGDVEKVRALGLQRYIDGQLRPDRIADADTTARLAGLTTIGLNSRQIAEQFELPQLQARRQRKADAKAGGAPPADAKPSPEEMQRANSVMVELSQQKLLRAVYSERQLQEVLTDFWFNHFNVDARKGADRFLLTEYERDTIRPRVLGKFRDLLGATAKSPAMLFYLDNWMSADPNGPHLPDNAGHPRMARGPFGGRVMMPPLARVAPQNKNAPKGLNENYGRELMELHTLGVDGGYSQKDVQELARVLTGVGINVTDKTPNLRPDQRALYVRQGFTEFNPGRHDMGEKLVLGRTVAGRGWNEVLDELGRLAAHPATARFVSAKLADYFVADTPPPALVDRMSQAFVRSDGDIAVTLAAMFDAPEFAASLASKFKDPMHYVVSAVRLAYDDRPIQNTAPLLGWLGRLGELPYNRQTPDGYPLGESAWASPGQMATRFEIARAIGTGSAGLFRAEGASVDAPTFPRLASAFYFQSIEPTLSASTRAALDRATSAQEWNVFLLSSPEFMLR